MVRLMLCHTTTRTVVHGQIYLFFSVPLQFLIPHMLQVVETSVLRHPVFRLCTQVT